MNLDELERLASVAIPAPSAYCDECDRTVLSPGVVLRLISCVRAADAWFAITDSTADDTALEVTYLTARAELDKGCA